MNTWLACGKIEVKADGDRNSLDERGSLTANEPTELMEKWFPIVSLARNADHSETLAVPVEILSDIHDRLLRAERTIERFEAAALESKVRSVHRHFLCRCGNFTAVTMLGVCQACYDKVRNG